jgi:hypothetical protein
MINRQDPMVACVIGYRLMHGEWPTLLRYGVDKGRLPIHRAIEERLEMVPARDGVSWIAEGGEGRQFKLSDDSIVAVSARTRGLLERWLGRPSRWLERVLHTPIWTTELGLYTRKRLSDEGAAAVGEVACRTAEELTAGGLSRDSLLEVATLLHDRGLALGMTVQSDDGGVVVTKSGVEPEQVFPRLDFEAVGAGGSTVPCVGGRRMTVLQALGALSEEHAAIAAAGLARRPALAGSAALERLLHAPLAGAARAARMNANQLVAYALNRVTAFHDMSDGVSSSWKAEVYGALTWVGILEYECGLRHYGISGEPCESYAELGARVRGIGEARAFQYVESFNACVRRLRPPLPVTQATVTVLRRLGKPVLLEQWWRTLPRSVRPEQPRDLAAMAALGEWGWLRRVTIEPCAGTFVAGLDAHAVRSHAVGIGAVFEESYDWGAANVGTAARLAQLSIRDTRAAFERDARWTRASSDWFVRSGRGGGTLGARARGLADCDACTTLEDLHRLLSNDEGLNEVRAARRGCEMPPAEVLARMLGAGTVRLEQRAA